MTYTTQTPGTDTRLTLTAPYTYDEWRMRKDWVARLIVSNVIYGTGAGKGWTIRLN